ncbi:MAG TPA: leucine-rich repeat domain-containing protein [Verrucomicrobiae bacterium]|nr:leucine-rich repeat domain-containing protein [Verrucomicrobiae bacterium]
MNTRILISLLTLACLLAISATAQVNYAVSGSTAYVASSPNASGNIVIASTYNGYPVTGIEDQAFYECTSLAGVTIPNSVTYIGVAAFSACTSLTNISVDAANAVYSALDGVLFDKVQTTLIQFPGARGGTYAIPNSVTFIGIYAFFDCASPTSVTIPNSVTNIGEAAFAGCTSLTNVTIPDSVTRIGVAAFSDCTSLTNVTIPNSVTSVEDYVFQNCTSLANVTIPNSVTFIGDYAFFDCTSLASVTIGNSVASIGYEAFYSCTSVTVFSVDAANSVYSSLDGVLFNKAQTTLIQFPGGRGGSYAIPNSVTFIGIYAFFDCASLTSVTIPNSVTFIGDYAFFDCTSLTSVTIPNSVTGIGDRAFSRCTSLSSVTIGSSVTFIGNYAFGDYAFIGGCTNLTNLTFLGNAPSEGVDMFDNIAASAKVYYHYGRTGWGTTYGGLPTVMLGAPASQVGAGTAGVKPGGFGFTLNGVVNQTIVVETSTNLVNWEPIWTRTLSTVSTNFVDSQWLNFPRRFYRAWSQ